MGDGNRKMGSTRDNPRSSSSREARPGRRKSTVLASLALIVSALFVASILIEVGYRVHLWLARPALILTPAGERFNPNGAGEYSGGRVTIDAFGFRNGIDLDAWKKPRKVMLIGDSVGFGAGVDDDQTINHLLNEQFRSSDLGFLNLSAPGWDTPVLRDRLYSQGTRLGPWHLIVWMYYINDAKSAITYFPPPSNAGTRRVGLLRKTQNVMYRFLKWPFIIKPVILRLLSEEDPRRASWKSYYRWAMSAYDRDSVTRKNEEKFIHDIVVWSNENNAELLFVVFPAETQFVDGNIKPQRFIEELGKQYNFPVINMMPYLARANEVGRVHLAGDPGHLNPRGLEIASNVIRDWLVSNGAVH